MTNILQMAAGPNASNDVAVINNTHSSDEDELTNYESNSTPDLSIGDFGIYTQNFVKLHLLSNNGNQGSHFCVQNVNSGDVFSSKHVKHAKEEIRIEAHILQKLKGRLNIINFHGYFESANVGVIVTEFLAGGDLVERTADPQFTLNEEKCRNYVKQICLGVEYIHAKRILHLDLKPFSVIFATRDGQNDCVKVSDFSLARFLPEKEDSIKIREMVGSLEFMSPEVLECQEATPFTDSYGIGIITFVLVTGGKSPFYGGNRFRTMAKILAGYIDLESATISPEAKDFVRKLLVLDPKERMSAADCLKHNWLGTKSAPVGNLHALETKWMKQVLARRRWQRWFNAVKAMQRMRKISSTSSCKEALK